MQVISDVTSIAANSLSANLIAGQVNEFLAGPSIVRVYATASAVGLRYIFQIGNEVYSQDQEISAANRFPIRPDDFFVQGSGGKGERIVLQARNTTGGAITSNALLEIVRVA